MACSTTYYSIRIGGAVKQSGLPVAVWVSEAARLVRFQGAVWDNRVTAAWGSGISVGELEKG